MKRVLSAMAYGASLVPLGLSWGGLTWAQVSRHAADPVAACAEEATIKPARMYDAIVFGDEVPGVMTALQLKQELWQRQKLGRIALVTEGNVDRGIGGHLVRGGLAYLDRNQVPPDLHRQQGVFGRPSPLYQRFLRMTHTRVIGLDRFQAAVAFADALKTARIEVIGNIQLQSVQTVGSWVCSLSTADGQTLGAPYFIDASQGGELAAASGVAMMQGFDNLGLPDSTLSLGLVLEVYGLSITRLQQLELKLIRRFHNPKDRQAQQWLTIASGRRPAQRRRLLASMQAAGRPKVMYQGTRDSADVRALALSVAIHGQLGQEYDLKAAGFLFDRANIAIFPDRLSINALLFATDARTARWLSQTNPQPTPAMQAVAHQIQQIFRDWGADRVEVMDELYIRSAGQIAHPVDELPATLMAAGGIPAETAIGTFSYALDHRGGIEGLQHKVSGTALATLKEQSRSTFNYGVRHTLPQSRQNLAVLGPASGFGGLGATAGRIVEFNVGVGQGLAIAVAKAIVEQRSLHSITNGEVRDALGYTPPIYGRPAPGFQVISRTEGDLRQVDFARSYLDQGLADLEQGNYAAAAQQLSRAITLNADQALAYYHRGNTWVYWAYYPNAIADYTEALRLNPRLALAYRDRGLVHLYQGQYRLALADFKRALRWLPTSAEARFGQQVARALQRQDASLSTSLPILDAAIQVQPELAVAYLLRGLTHMDLGEHRAALADLTQAGQLYQDQNHQLGYDHTQRLIQTLSDAQAPSP